MIKKVVLSGFVGGLVVGLLQLVRMDTVRLIKTMFASFDIVSSANINRHPEIVSETAAELLGGSIFFTFWLAAGSISAFLGRLLSWKVYHYQRAWVIWGAVFWVGLEVNSYLGVKNNPHYESNWFISNMVPFGIFTFLSFAIGVVASCLYLRLSKRKTELQNT